MHSHLQLAPKSLLLSLQSLLQQENSSIPYGKTGSCLLPKHGVRQNSWHGNFGSSQRSFYSPAKEKRRSIHLSKPTDQPPGPSFLTELPVQRVLIEQPLHQLLELIMKPKHNDAKTLPFELQLGRVSKHRRCCKNLKKHTRDKDLAKSKIQDREEQNDGLPANSFKQFCYLPDEQSSINPAS